jgi:predicted transcriptional regulator
LFIRFILQEGTEGLGLKLEQIIASSCRQKILLALSRIKRTHLNDLIRTVDSTYNQVNSNLQILEKEGIVKIRRFGHIKMIELDVQNQKTQALLKALHILSNQGLDPETP